MTWGERERHLQTAPASSFDLKIKPVGLVVGVSEAGAKNNFQMYNDISR